jgi:hypothetical protein
VFDEDNSQSNGGFLEERLRSCALRRVACAARSLGSHTALKGEIGGQNCVTPAKGWLVVCLGCVCVAHLQITLLSELRFKRRPCVTNNQARFMLIMNLIGSPSIACPKQIGAARGLPPPHPVQQATSGDLRGKACLLSVQSAALCSVGRQDVVGKHKTINAPLKCLI